MRWGWIPGLVAMVGTVAWLVLEPAPTVRPCADGPDCGPGERCEGARCVAARPPEPIRLLFAARTGREREPVRAPCGDGICDLAAGECVGACPADCPDVPCALPCKLDGVCSEGEGATCPDCYPAGCNFDGLCTVGESPRCPDCSCGDGYCDTGAGECIGTCPGDCPGTRCERVCDFDAACEAGESESCPDCTCGDDICDPAVEDCAVCALDCGPCAAGCGDGICTADDPPGCPDCEVEDCDPLEGCE
ncbi:hypothetical protein [Vulgatibacter sp.]|uniref:hypothetical protein n=1 Tax=Vulgatibacter sp. TaxID=1971226 RepID=UPI0035645592